MRSRNSSGHFLGLAIAGASPFPRTNAATREPRSAGSLCSAALRSYRDPPRSADQAYGANLLLRPRTATLYASRCGIKDFSPPGWSISRCGWPWKSRVTSSCPTCCAVPDVTVTVVRGLAAARFAKCATSSSSSEASRLKRRGSRAITHLRPQAWLRKRATGPRSPRRHDVAYPLWSRRKLPKLHHHCPHAGTRFLGPSRNHSSGVRGTGFMFSRGDIRCCLTASRVPLLNPSGTSRSPSRSPHGPPRCPRRAQPVLRALLPHTQLDVHFAQCRLQLLDLLQQGALARIGANPAAVGQTRLATLEKQPLPGADRLLVDLATTSRLRHAHLSRDDRENDTELVFNRKNRKTRHWKLASEGARHYPLPDFVKQDSHTHKPFHYLPIIPQPPVMIKFSQSAFPYRFEKIVTP